MLNINLNAPSICIEKNDINKQKYLDTVVSNLNDQVFDLKSSLKIHKSIVQNLLSENKGSQDIQVVNDLFWEMLRIKENFEDLNEEK